MSCVKRAAVVGAILALGVAPAGVTAKSTSATGAKAEAGKSSADAANSSRKLRKAITSQRMFKHLQAWQGIADANGGNRASGFEGYGASAEYVRSQLRAAGYNPTTQVFSFVTFQELSDPVLQEISPTAKTYTQDEFFTMSYSGSGDTGTRTIVPIDVNLGNPAASTSGCEVGDFAGFPAGAIALPVRSH
jgi:hypothetical protein